MNIRPVVLMCTPKLGKQRFEERPHLRSAPPVARKLLMKSSAQTDGIVRLPFTARTARHFFVVWPEPKRFYRTWHWLLFSPFSLAHANYAKSWTRWTIFNNGRLVTGRPFLRPTFFRPLLVVGIRPMLCLPSWRCFAPQTCAAPLLSSALLVLSRDDFRRGVLIESRRGGNRDR